MVESEHGIRNQGPRNSRLAYKKESRIGVEKLLFLETRVPPKGRAHVTKGMVHELKSLMCGWARHVRLAHILLKDLKDAALFSGTQF